MGVFYSDNLSDEIYPTKPLANSRGYTCLFAQLAKLHNGTPLAFDIENLGCFGSILNIFGGIYNEEVTCRLLVEIERFKANNELANKLREINPVAHPKGRYIVFKPLDKLTEKDNPEIFCIFGNPDMMSALHTLVGFDKTRIDNVIVPFGAGCEQMITFAFAEAEKDSPRAILGGMDTAMRGCLKSNTLTFSVSASTFKRMIYNAESTFLETYIWKGLCDRK